jgi:hypothetical protein
MLFSPAAFDISPPMPAAFFHAADFITPLLADAAASRHYRH